MKFFIRNCVLRRLSTVAAVLILLMALPVNAQEEATLVERGLLAYASEDYTSAVNLLEEAISDDPANAEAYYHLGRILFDEQNPNRNLMRARSEISRAEDLEPENVLYKAAKLEHLRVRQWNFFENFLRQQQRLDLAKDILKLDPDNALAHEELGEQSIRDYYVYHNAISMPTVRFHSQSYDFEIQNDESTENVLPGPDPDQDDSEPIPSNPETSQDFLGLEGSEGTLSPGEYAAGDRFNIAQIASQGGTSIDMRRRAEAAYDHAIGHLEKALEQDPRRRGVYDHLIRLAAIEGRYEDIMGPLGEMIFHFGDETETWLYTGLANHRLGSDEAADKAFREALDRMAPEQRAIFEDIDMIRAPGETELDSKMEEAAFWTSRNPRYLTTFNERKIEHYARLTYADLMYSSDKLGMRGWETERGEIHVRYGVPGEDIMITGNFQQALESYDGREERVGTRMGTDGELERSESRERLFSQLNRFNVWDYGDFKFVFEDPSRNGEFALYSPPADMFGAVGRGMTDVADNMDYVIRTRETIRETPDRYDYEAPGRQVELPYRLAAFRGESGNADVYLNYGIPLAGEVGANRQDVDVTVQTGAFLISENYELPAQRRRTIYGLKGSQIVEFDSLRLWANTEALVAAPGAYQVSLEFETTDGSTLGVQRRDIEVPDFSGSGLQMSEILLAYSVEPANAGQPGAVFRDGLLIRPAPWGVYRTTDPIYLYFEMYGLGMNGGQTNYEVEAELRPKDTRGGIGGFVGRIFGGDEPGVSNAFPVQADRSDDTQYVILDAVGQEPGLYTLIVRVEDHLSGQTVERETELFLE